MRSSITLPVDSDLDLVFWSEMLRFLNMNKGNSYTVQLDGMNYTLNAT